jgi:hypothetical protein
VTFFKAGHAEKADDGFTLFQNVACSGHAFEFLAWKQANRIGMEMNLSRRIGQILDRKGDIFEDKFCFIWLFIRNRVEKPRGQT